MQQADKLAKHRTDKVIRKEAQVATYRQKWVGCCCNLLIIHWRNGPGDCCSVSHLSRLMIYLHGMSTHCLKASCLGLLHYFSEQCLSVLGLGQRPVPVAQGGPTMREDYSMRDDIAYVETLLVGSRHLMTLEGQWMAMAQVPCMQSS
jgi:hypothetical protein